MFRSKRDLTFVYTHHGRRFTLDFLGSDEVDQYQTFFNELSEESIRCRFGNLLAKLTPSSAKERLPETEENEIALAIFEAHRQRIVAIGRCHFDHQAKDAEIALVVADRMRRQGLGQFLLDQLLRVARSRDMKTISAYIATPNAPVIALLQAASFVIEPPISGDDVKLVLTIAPPLKKPAKRKS